MGCKQSKVNDPVVEAALEPVAVAEAAPAGVVDAPVEAAADTKREDTAAEESKEEAAPASEKPVEEAPTSAAPASTTPVSEAPTSVAPASAAPVSSAPISAAPASVAPVSSAPVSAAPTSATPASAAPASEAPVSTAPNSIAAVPEESIVDNTPGQPGEETQAEEPKDEVPVSEKPVDDATPNQPEDALTFKSSGVSFNEKGIAFYGFEGINPADPAKTVTVSKRYSEFKVLYADMATIMASESNVPASQTDKFETYPALPALPKGSPVTLLRGRGNKKITQEREAQFEKILNAIARHPIAVQNDKFSAFLA